MKSSKNIIANPWVTFVIGIISMLVVFGAPVLLAGAQTKLSCHTPKSTKTEYCVYAQSRPGPLFMSTTHKLLIGPSAGRGVVYAVPEDASKATVEWSANDNAVVTLHGTTITIQPDLYIDKR